MMIYINYSGILIDKLKVWSEKSQMPFNILSHEKSLVASAQKMHAGLFSGATLEILLRGFQKNYNYQGRFGDLRKEELISVVDL